ncbi:glycosyltransferase [Aquibacillus halophilus]|uniref:Glycosyltransferase n=1 Tax=Aquibacillus halophilus TaxID=930132 RepID=A0A6A8DDV9_9BACI|nr:glycosyltransferase [Aquibacillus halophilus]
MEPKITVIVPVYKAEQYIHKCIDSILSQTFECFELILINDGTPDKSGKICDEYALKDNRVIVNHKPNGGVSSARNNGIKIAKGEYMLFVDSDDWIEPNTLSTLIDHTLNDENDVIIFGLIKDLFSKKELIKSEYNGFFKKQQISIEDLRNNFIYFLNSVGMHPSWMYLFKTDIIVEQNLYFDSKLVLYEDFDFNLRYLNHSSKITFIPDALYHYNLDASTNQLAKRNKINIVSDISTVCNSLFDFINHTNQNMMLKKNAEQMYSYVLPMYTLCLKNIIIHKKVTKMSEKFEVLKQLHNDENFRLVMLHYANSIRFYKFLFILLNKKLYLFAYLLLLYKFYK